MGKPLVLGLAGLALVSAATAAPPLTRFTFIEPHMGTRFKLIVYAADEKTANAAAKAAFARVAQLDGIMSDYRPTSELMRLCRQAGGKPVKVSEELFFILEKSKELSEK